MNTYIWMPIETAIKDENGPEILTLGPYGDVSSTAWWRGKWQNVAHEDPEPTHWMPLPPLPEQTS